MKLNIKYILISIIVCFFMYIPDVFAASIGGSQLYYNGKAVHKRYTNEYNRNIEPNREMTGANYDPTETSWKPSKYEIMNVNGIIAFCIEIGVGFDSTGYAVEKTIYDNYYSYYISIGMGESVSKIKAQELVNLLSLYMKIGSEYINKTSGDQQVRYILATQELIWKAIDNTGYYNSVLYKNRTGAAFKIGNDFEWKAGSSVNDQQIIVNQERSEIEKGVETYYKLPSMCSGTEQLNIEPGETETYTDNNNVLQSYSITCNGGITCSVSGNKLTVKANSNNGNQRVFFTKKTVEYSNIKSYQSGGWQAVIYYQGVPSGPSCEMGPVKINNCEYRYEYKSTRTISTDIYDMENNLVATETNGFSSNTKILAGTYVGLNITEVQKADVIVKDSTIKVTGNVSFADCRRAAIADALKKAGATQDGVLNWGAAYTTFLPDGNDIDENSNIKISSSEANKKNCYVADPATGSKSLDSDCLFDYANSTYIQKIVNNAKNGVNTATMYINYEYKKMKTCINVKTSEVGYISSSNSDCNSNELEVESDTINGQEHWHYFIPLNTASNNKLFLLVRATNLKKNDTSGGVISIRIPTEQKFYLEGPNGITLKGFNFYYKPIDIDNPFPNINMTDICNNGITYASLWSDWLLAKCSNKSMAPVLSKSFDAVTYIAADIDVDTVRAYTANNPYTSWSNMTVNGKSNYINNNGIIRRNGTQTVYKLGCGPSNMNKYKTGTTIEDPLYINGCS